MEYDYYQNWYVTVECKMLPYVHVYVVVLNGKIFKSVDRTFDNIFEN